ncbi:ABC transporter substrate-binding protein [uncultured Dubosiella sp.]|uniref:ABC transporter substrate-binding protein n=1 Tax=uncultured Dubosiella sp. TaxID=1937011 RepID=UPI000ED160F4|nr:extracellular solute-binding protein [uncultured Dubosiella sp.]GJM58031.1 sugar ABC transporter substrate-binding protein [Erysipelotrichaceae bacterium OPF54]HAM31008.1 sugar ABC transporter substrate-binding protein [Erysipelotrichaceae bacterium]
MNTFQKAATSVLLSFLALSLSGCGNAEQSSIPEIEILSYKREAVDVMNEIEDLFNSTHDDVRLKISSPNEAMTILKTRLIRDDYPDIVAIGGDINYSNFLDADLFMDISDLPALSDVKPGYLDIDKQLELVEKEGTYALPYVANAAGILYNKDLFDQYNWKIPATWDEFIQLCQDIQSKGLTPLYFGYKDTWTTLAPWNALAVDLVDADICAQVNKNEAAFADAYKDVARKQKELLKYCQPNPYAYSYTDAATAFANGEAVMWPIGSYAISQVQSVNPDMNIDSFVMPGSNVPEENILNSGIDVQFSVLENCPDKEAAYEVLDFLYSDEVLNMYLEDQGGIATKKGDFPIMEYLKGMETYILSGQVADYQDHHYPTEMAVDAMIQTYLLDEKEDALETFLNKFDSDWQRYNRDVIERLRKEE